MALSLNTNIPALKAAHQLARNQFVVDQALERLSTGLRINSAKDDAAGLAIATRFDAQINGQQVARRNAADGISLAQTAEGALEEITNNLQRVRELALQSANATNSDADRTALDNEVQQRLQEVDRIARQTGFNGLKLLDGSLGELRFQVGANVGNTITLDLDGGVRRDQIGGLAEGKLSLSDAAFTNGELDSQATMTLAVDSGDPQEIVFEAGVTIDDMVVAIEGADVPGLVSASVRDGAIRLRASGEVRLGGSDLATVFDDPPETIEQRGSLDGAGIRTVDDANAAILRVDDAMDGINRFRSRLGAIQNRFESTINNLDNSVENLSASRSRIMDANFAAEASRLARGLVLEQASIAVLTQANVRNQFILRLLQ